MASGRRIHLDFETRSLLDVRVVGGWTYSIHPTTSIICAAYAVDDNPVQLTVPAGNESENVLRGIELRQLAADPENIFVAHNAFFEQCIWKNIMVPRYGMPEIPIERWRCTAAKAASMSLPRPLGDVAEILELPVKKDETGKKSMEKLSRPRRGRFGGDVVFWEYDDAPDDFEDTYKYCMTDVEVERLIDNRLPELNAREQKVWFLDQKINFTGIRVDVPAVQKIMGFIERTVTDMTEEFQRLTGGMLEGPSQVKKLREWLAENGCHLANLQAPTVDKALLDPSMDETVRRVLEIRRQLSKISTAKYSALLNRVDPRDSRIRDILLYAAAITKRWGGRGPQIHNFPRGTVNTTVAWDFILNDDYDFLKLMYRDLMAVYSSCTRGALVSSPGHDLYVSDFSSIEAMVLPWLAGDEEKLDIFREGRDLYCETAGGILGRPVNKKDHPMERQGLGKVSELALGYGGGIGAYGNMAKGYQVDLHPVYDLLWNATTEAEKELARKAYTRYIGRAEKAEDPDPLDRESGYVADIIKQRWRVKNWRIVKFWDDLERAAIQAILTGEKCVVGDDSENPNRPKITFGMYGHSLLCKLPSGNCIVYPFAKVSVESTDWGTKRQTVSYRAQNDENFQYHRTWTYGGKFSENITQAVARDILAEALLRLDAAEFKVIMHVHDEPVAEHPEDDDRLEEFNNIVAEAPEWATGLPIRAEAWKGKRYKK